MSAISQLFHKHTQHHKDCHSTKLFVLFKGSACISPIVRFEIYGPSREAPLLRTASLPQRGRMTRAPPSPPYPIHTSDLLTLQMLHHLIEWELYNE